MKAVIYARYSSERQREESIEGQLRECKKYAEYHDIKIVGTYIDRALTGKTDKRPEFQRMVRDSAKGRFDIVLVWKLDRFARSRHDSAVYKKVLRECGVRVVSATEAIVEGSGGILFEGTLESFAEYYSAELSEKVQRGMTENALKGKHNGGTVPLGYVVDEELYLQIDPSTAPLVLEVFTRYANGEKLSTIIADFNARGLRTKRNRPYNPNSFSTVLKNRKYIGEYKFQDIVIPDHIPPIVPLEIFEKVQERRTKNKHAPARSNGDVDFLLTTKLFCGDCGKMMAGDSGTSKTGKSHYYYKCGAAKRRKGCAKKAVRKEWLERSVVAVTVNHALRDDIIEKTADALLEHMEKESALLPSLSQQLKEVQKGIENMLNAIQQGIITSSTKERLEELEMRKEELEISIIQEEAQKPLLNKKQIVSWIRKFKDGDIDSIEYQQQIIDTFVNAIFLFDDRISFTYNYTDGIQTIALEELEGSDLAGDGPPRKDYTSVTGAVTVWL